MYSDACYQKLNLMMLNNFFVDKIIVEPDFDWSNAHDYADKVVAYKKEMSRLKKSGESSSWSPIL